MTSTPARAETFISTTRYQTALTTHAGQPACPTPGDGNLPSWYPDDKYEYCCRTQSGAGYVETLTSGPGPGGKSLTACCQRGFLCTGAAPFVFDWSMSTEVVTVPGRSFVRSTIVTFPLTITQQDDGGGGGNVGPAATTVTATVTITTSPVIVVGGENDGRLKNAEVAATVIGVATFLIAVFTLYVGYKNPPARLRPILEKLHITKPQAQEAVAGGDATDQP
ncbi:hypothetical protein V8F33_007897 [Rhypophila sp. PSN 637]